MESHASDHVVTLLLAVPPCIRECSRTAVGMLAWAGSSSTCEGENDAGQREPCSTCFLSQHLWTWFSYSICETQSSQNNPVKNKQLRTDENRANNTVIRKKAKAQIAVSSMKGEAREGKCLYVPYAAQGTQIWPQIAAVCSKGTVCHWMSPGQDGA